MKNKMIAKILSVAIALCSIVTAANQEDIESNVKIDKVPLVRMNLKGFEAEIARKIFNKPAIEATSRPSLLGNKIQLYADKKRNKWSSIAASFSTAVESKSD